MRTLRIELPWPAACLSPNGRAHWRRKALATKRHRWWALLAAQDAIRAQRWPAGVKQAEVRITYRDPVSRRRDRDNHLGMCKAYLDGLTEAGVIEDDCGFICHPVAFEQSAVRSVVIEVVPRDVGKHSN